VIYARVSTDEQADKGYNLQSQIEACGKYAHAYGLEIAGRRYFDKDAKTLVAEPNENTVPVRCFVNDYTGTVPIESRPEGRKANEMLRSNQADVLIAYRIDRIVRPPEEGDEWGMPMVYQRRR
jgi:DNA invertase Pin-like site-specific DNA recombinase